MGKQRHDWESIGREYRIGQKSLRVLSAEFGPTPGAISKRASKYGWVRDLTAEVRHRTRAALLKETPAGNTQGNTVTRESEALELAVQVNVRVIREHRRDIQKGRDLVNILYGQLSYALEKRAEIEGDIILETDGDPNAKRRNAMLKAVALPTHAGILRDLSVALKNLIPLERQAFGLDSDGTVQLDEVLAAAEKINPALGKALRAALKNS